MILLLKYLYLFLYVTVNRFGIELRIAVPDILPAHHSLRGSLLVSSCLYIYAL